MATRLAIIIGAVGLSISAGASARGAYGSGLNYGYDTPFVCDNPYDNSGYATDNCGWYNGFFYPGFGDFVFDRDHNRRQMSDGERGYFNRQPRNGGVGGGSFGGSRGFGDGSFGGSRGFGGGMSGGSGGGRHR